MKALTYSLELLEPLLITKAQSDEPNSASTELFISGSAIRGALIGRYLNQLENRDGDLLKDDWAWRLFFSHEVFFLNAYLAYIPKRTRLLPRPLSWFVEKDERNDHTAEIHDFAIRFNEQMKSPKTPRTGDFVYQPQEEVHLAKPKIKTIVHNLSVDRNRKREGISNVFRYDSLAAGQWFAGVILSEDDKALQDLEALLKAGDFKLGGSHTGGYGWVRIDAVESEENWKEYEAHGVQPVGSNTEEEKIIITLLSDVIVRGRNGQMNDDFDEGLSLALEAAGQKPAKVHHLQAYQEHKLVGGFNRKWGLPLPQAMAIKAGSVFVYKKAQIDEETLRKLIASGIGERLNEGFGRIGVNWHREKSWKQVEFTSSPSREEPPALRENSESFELARGMANTRLRNLLDQQLIRIISDVHWKGEKSLDHLSAAQLTQMRLAAQKAYQKADLKIIENQIDEIRRLKSAKERWERVYVGKQRLIEWLKDWISFSGEKFKTEFKLIDELPKVAGVSAEFDEKIRIQYCARVIDGVIKKAIKELQKREEGDEQKA